MMLFARASKLGHGGNKGSMERQILIIIIKGVHYTNNVDRVVTAKAAAASTPFVTFMRPAAGAGVCSGDFRWAFWGRRRRFSIGKKEPFVQLMMGALGEVNVVKINWI